MPPKGKKGKTEEDENNSENDKQSSSESDEQNSEDDVPKSKRPRASTKKAVVNSKKSTDVKSKKSVEKKAPSLKSISNKKKPEVKSKSKNMKKDVDEEENEDDVDDDKMDDDSNNGDESGSENSGETGGSDNDNDDDNDQSDDQNNNNEPKTKRSRAASTSKSAKSKISARSKSKKDVVKKSSTKQSNSSSTTERKNKQLKKGERLEEARMAYKWWEVPDLPDGINWRTLEHPAINFPPEYIPHRIPILYDGKPVNLTRDQEEIASFYAALPLDGPQLGNPKTRTVFQANFFEDFKSALGPSHVIKKFDKCNFDDIKKYLDYQKSLKKTASDGEKLIVKEEKEQLLLKYGYALIDGRIEKMVHNLKDPCSIVLQFYNTVCVAGQF